MESKETDPKSIPVIKEDPGKSDVVPFGGDDAARQQDYAEPIARLEKLHLILPKKSLGAVTLKPLKSKVVCAKCNDKQTIFEVEGAPRCLSCTLYKDIHLRLKPPRIGELLRDAGVITQEQINTVLKAKRERFPNKLFGEILVELKFFTPAQILAVFASQYNIEYIDLTHEKVNPIALRNYPVERFKDGYPYEIYKQYQVVCFDKRYQTYSIGLVDHLNEDAMLAIAQAFGKKEVNITPYLISLGHWMALFQKETKAIDLHDLSKEEETRGQVLDVEESRFEQDEIVHEQFLRVLREAIRSRASDIRYEFTDRVFRVRFRIDGRLATFENYPKTLGKYMLNKIRLESKVDVIRRKDERADGSFPITLDDRTYNLRACFMPSVYEQLCVIRILYRQELIKDLKQLGFSERSMRLLNEASERPHGLVVLAGPMGSGKTTTLYSLIFSKSMDDSIAVVSLEEPVEFILPNITQIPIDSKQQHTRYDAILPGILRVDPDIVLVGETRDRTSAENVYRLALIGKLLFTSVHANDSPGVISRFLNFGIEPYLIASSTILILSQRLIRVLCRTCRIRKEVPPDVFQAVGFDYRLSYAATIYEADPKGCELCNSTGYRGRTAITEALEITPQIEDLILKKVPEQMIRKQAILDGMVTLKAEGLDKILNGLTSIAEVLAATGKQEDPMRLVQKEEISTANAENSTNTGADPNALRSEDGKEEDT